MPTLTCSTLTHRAAPRMRSACALASAVMRCASARTSAVMRCASASASAVMRCASACAAPALRCASARAAVVMRSALACASAVICSARAVASWMSRAASLLATPADEAAAIAGGACSVCPIAFAQLRNLYGSLIHSFANSTKYSDSDFGSVGKRAASQHSRRIHARRDRITCCRCRLLHASHASPSKFQDGTRRLTCSKET